MASLTSVSKTKHLVSHLKSFLRLVTKGLDDARKFDAQGFGCLRRKGILALSLEDVHSVQSEGFDFYKSLCFRWLGFIDIRDV